MTHFVPTPLLGFEVPTQPPGPTLATLIGPEGPNPPSYISYNPFAPLETIFSRSEFIF